MPTYELVPLSEADIPALIDLSARLGWDYQEPELRTLLASGTAFGHKTAEGLLVSSAAIFPYGEKLASLGMVMVHPDHRRQGLGALATQRAMDWLGEVGIAVPVMLVATAQGQPLYERLGYKTVETLHKCLAERYTAPSDVPSGGSSDVPSGGSSDVPQDTMASPLATLPEGSELVEITADEALQEPLFTQLLALEETAVGGPRRQFLARRIRQAAQRLVMTQGGEVTGFALAVQGPVYLIIGPVAAPDEQCAVAMIYRLARTEDVKIRIDVPSCHGAVVEHLVAHGFEVVNVPPVMLSGAERLERDLSKLYAIAAQAFG